MPTLDARPAKLDIVAAAGDDVAVTLTTTTTTWLDGETLSAPVTTFDGTATGVSFTTSWSAGTLQLSLTDTATGTTLGEGSYKWRLTGTESGVTSTHLAGVLRLTAQSSGSGSTSVSGTVTVTSQSVALTVNSSALGTITDHIADTVDAHDASAISLLDTAGYYTATDVEAGLAELPGALPRFVQRDNTVIPIGDSLISGSSNGNWDTATYMLSGARLTQMRNAGTSGNTSTQMLARIQTDVIAYNPGWCIIQVTPNDPSNGLSVSTSLSNIKAMVAACKAAGIRPIVALGPPSDTAATRAHILNVNANLNLWCPANGVPMLDLYTPLADYTDGTYLASLTADGIHPNAAGVGAVAQYNAPLLRAIVTQRRPNQVTAGLNDPTNLIAGGLFGVDTNADGVADSWIKSGTATCSRTAVTAGSGLGFWQNISPIDSTLTQVYQDVTTSIGNVYEVSCRVQATSSGYRLRVNGILDTPTSSSTAASVGDIAETADAIISVRFTAIANPTRILMGAGGAVGTTSFAQMTMRDLTAVTALG